ncbi:MAG: hypothetical protein A3E98_01215 [Candidatus Doudnabacteria bacterium RIFCSPHIGHO2_12_FULL_48_11]|uniref:Uncharacterized protein n=1 Tax=Candidatus Doudnabacteria bacterium RIFCSPHIGHO2_01_FULL_46_24 TaxID=1817825 RepID=A0A1F5NW18_9BACT|nr:MAG: hypothetical protein A2720_00065 [Candidatus Doudnabacteria bacterium RIFCSPHIGHO2_01_FULL_46_24]OGE95602.1 MAG: hypothetical protein A3E98_01215 [Candidatus Doudnabacteria bacterium RIFCSPHIGHO2_12_FULL_48_11]
MADDRRDNRRDRGNGRDKGRGKGDKPKQDPRPVLKVSGVQSQVFVTVTVPGKPQPGALVTFGAGPEGNAERNRVKIGDKPVAVRVETDGVARGMIDMSKGSSDATHMAACFQGRYSEPVEIPAEGEPKKETSGKKKARLKVLPEGDQDSMDMKYAMEILTYDEKGEKPTTGVVEFAASESVTLVNRAANTILATNVKFFTLNVGANGRLLLEVQYSGLECRISFRHAETDERADKTLAFL